ncbi:MAG: mechanosensitive ion channel [Cognatishimia sp.]|uniref:mechanosensitive ion channel family protein n=1 Tax=Cognatishimia sp. TaxID=2211648 RepID=UPI003B8B266E
MAEHETTLEETEATDTAPAETDAVVPAETGTEQDTQEIALSLWDQIFGFAEGLLRPWNAYQVLIVIGLLLLAFGLSRVFSPKLHEWMRTREGWPKWRYRYMLLLQKRMALIIFVALIWITVLVMREITWPSRSYLLGIFANLGSAWLIIALITRLVHNSFLRGLLRYGAWAWVTLVLIGLSEEFRQLMDSAALNIGTIRLSLWTIVQAVVMLGLTFAVARFVAGSTTASIKKNDDISPSMQVLVIKFMQVLLYGAAFFIGLKIVGVDLTGLAVLSGAIGVGLGFGLQKVVSNLVSGIIILLDKSIKPGDVISLGETFGWINSLGARYVSVVTRDGKEYLIPNEDLITGQVVNWSHSDDYVRLDIFFGTAYGDDPHVVRKVAIEAAMSVDRILRNPKTPVCHIVGFGDSSVDYILRFWIEDPTGGLTNIRGNVYLALWDAFQREGINFPFPQREVRVLGEDHSDLTASSKSPG